MISILNCKHCNTFKRGEPEPAVYFVMKQHYNLGLLYYVTYQEEESHSSQKGAFSSSRNQWNQWKKPTPSERARDAYVVLVSKSASTDLKNNESLKAEYLGV